MRLSEITDKNITINILKGIDPNFEQEYNRLMHLLNLLIQQRSHSRNRRVQGNIDDFTDRANNFLNTDYVNDPDITALKEKVLHMKQNIIKLSEQLI